jgi:hypothetical protein
VTIDDAGVSSSPEHSAIVVPDVASIELGGPADPSTVRVDEAQQPRTRGDMLKVGGVALGAAVAGSLAGAGTASATTGGGLLFLANPQRFYDTRQATTSGKLVGGNGNIGTLRQVSVTGLNPGVFAIFGNLATTQQDAPGFLTLWPGNTAWPGVASINFVPGVDLANYFFCGLGSGNTILLAASQGTHVIIDVTGVVSN